jgi:XTP/dITP diphosphohydrolase
MKKIVFATNNPHKLLEVRVLLGNIFEIVSLKDIGFEEDIPETGVTLAENASQKSHFIFERYGLNCFADDTGLEVDALDGAPGVYSARYAGEHASYEENVTKLLDALEGEKNRAACFKTVVSLILNGMEFLFEGRVEGQILKQRSGNSGFGYDPVFLPDGYSKSFAEMPSELKNSISHRGKAMQKLLVFLGENDLRS